MKHVGVGIIAGFILGVIDVLLISSMPVPNKEMVLLGAFSNRFAIGLFAATAQFGLPLWLQGAIVGLLISVLPAVSNPGFLPMILGLGTIGGLITGITTQKLSKTKKKK